MRRQSYILLLAGLAGISACKPDADFRTPAANYTPEHPAHFPPAHYTHDKNTYSQAGFELGRKLFFDPILSANNTISCGSCHKQEHAFADVNIRLSKGIDGQTGTRHTPAIFNIAWNTSFMWDGGVNHIEVMPLTPLTNKVEMAETISNIVYKLNRHKEYPTLFKNVFHRDSIDDQQMFWALAQYMSNLVSASSKYDDVYTGKTTYTKDEQEGYNLFKKNCSTCHTEPLLTDYSFKNNGLDYQFTDSGRYRITRQEEDWGSFKVPTLRNIAVTSPYMHDGRFTTLEQVLHHYADSVKQTPSLSPLLVKNGKPGLHLTADEQRKIILFLHTLTDTKFLTKAGLTE